MSPRTLVSVVVPTYADRASRLRSALATVWAQEGLGESFDVETIVVDDASWGPTEDVLSSFPRTRYIRFDTNRGAAAARNAALQHATGEYVAFMDDDDLWLPRRLAVQVAALEQAERQPVAYSQMIGVYSDGTSNVTPKGGPSGWVFDAVFRGDVSFGTVLIPSHVLDVVGTFDEHLPAGEDRDWLMRMALRVPFLYVPGPVTVYVASQRDWISFSDPKIESWFLRRDKILELVDGASNEEAIRQLVESGTWVHVISMLIKARRFEEARGALLQELARSPMNGADDWYSSGMKRLLARLAVRCDSIRQTRSLLADVKRAQGAERLVHRLKARSLCADIWTDVALHYTASRHRDDRRAAAGAALAILENPLKAVNRPGLVRLLGRGPVALLNGKTAGRTADESISDEAASW